MTPHERILDIADFAEGDPRRDGLVALGKADAAALRELDKLLEDSKHFLDGLAPTAYPIWEEFHKRLTQAGY